MKANMTNFDINAIITELTQRLGGSELKNIFEFNNIFFFRFRTKQEGTQVLVVEPGKRIHLTKFKRNFPPEPSGLCKAFRIHIKGKWLKNIYQYDFDRVCVMEFEAQEKVYTLIIELFGKGNVILISPENRIYVAKNYKRMRDRDIHPGIDFQFPPTTGKNFLEADFNWVREELKNSDEKDIQTAISKVLNINKDYSTEICLRSELDPKITPSKLTEEQIEIILKVVKDLRKILVKGKLEPTVYYEKDGKEKKDIVPYPLKIYEDYKAEKSSSFSEIIDEYFSTFEMENVSSVELSVEDKKVKQLVEVRRKQEEHKKSMQDIADEEKEKGSKMYLYLTEIDELLTTITNARRNNVDWSEIKEKLEIAKKKGMKGARILKEIKEKNKLVIVTLDELDVELDFLKSASDNASDMYKRAKKSESKIPGAQKKIDELNERIKKLEEGYEQLAQKETVMIEKRKKEWFEKFHWFKSSDGFLVIAGKDLRTNNELVKKYLEKSDLFLHAEIHGAAVVIIKGEGKKIPQTTIDEAAIFSVCYSKAWKDKVSIEDTFYVTPDQVSFSAPSGEYLAKGSFIISGTKNQLKNIPLEIAIYPKIEEKNAYVLSGPLAAIQALPDVDKSKIVKVVPGDTIKSKTAKRIVEIFAKNLDESDTKKIRATALDELISILPGDCLLKND
ncbi:MAG TPA: ribosome rescue protein RqcH [candidate division Zixibacteria bacterium]|nr:ribosome rescue protein RqcH [candidate division Zixibacteria bacterium]